MLYSLTFLRLLTRCGINFMDPKDVSSYPQVICSRGGGVLRLRYSNIARETACKGYIVAYLEYLHDTLVIVFPKGRLLHGIDIDSVILELVVQFRTQDVSFVLYKLV